MISLGSVIWDSELPTIRLTFEYEKRRSGADMQYRARMTVDPLTGSSYFGYSIFLKLNINGNLISTTTLKNPTPSQWSESIIYTSAWFTVQNKTTGTTPISFNVYSESYLSNRNKTFNYSMGVDPAASTFTISSGSLGVSKRITISKNNSSFTSTIKYECGTTTGTITTKSTLSSISWTPPISLSRHNTTGTKVACKITVITYSGSDEIGSVSKDVTFDIPTSVKPSISITLSDPNGYNTKYGSYIQYKSKIKVNISSYGSYGSTIKGYSTTANESTYTSSSFTTDFIKKRGTLRIKTTVTDSRGRSATLSKTINVMDYAPPKITRFDAYRVNADGNKSDKGDYIRYDVWSSITSLNNKNSVSYVLKYKKTSMSTYTSVNKTAWDNNYALAGEHDTIYSGPTDSYDLIIQATDDFSTTSKSIAVTPATRLWSISRHASGLAIAFGKISEIVNSFEVAWKAIFYNGIYHVIGGRKREPVKMIEGDDNGDGILIEASGLTIVSGGEGGTRYLEDNNISGSEKKAIIASDRGVDIITNLSAGSSYSKKTTIDTAGNITCPNYIYSKSLSLENGHMNIKKTDGTITGSFGFSSALNDIYLDITSGKRIRFEANVNETYTTNTLSIFREQLSTGTTIFRCDVNGGANLGSSGYRWNTAYFTNEITASDLKEKKVIYDFDFKILDFIMGLKPIAYKRIGEGDTGKRIHMGFGAQDVDSLIKALDLGDMSLVNAVVVNKKNIENDDGSIFTEVYETPYYGEEISDDKLSWGLNYSEFIAPIIVMLQKQEKEIRELKTKLENLQNKY